MQIRLINVRQHLLSRTIERFEDGFNRLDTKMLRECILVFFNLEVLREQVQARVNATLKTISQIWRNALSSVQNLSTVGALTKNEQSARIREYLTTAISEIVQYTKKIHTLARAL